VRGDPGAQAAVSRYLGGDHVGVALGVPVWKLAASMTGRGGDGVTHDELGVAEPEGPGDAGRTGAGW
jgi:hypothetical protein